MRYRFDTDGIHMKWGVIFRREVLLNYSRSQDIHLRSNLIERWLGLARIEIQTASGSANANMTLEGMEDPGGMRDFLYSRMRGSREEKGGGADPVAAVLLEIAVFCALRLAVREARVEQQRSVGGGALDGLAMVLRSRYLAGILCWVALLSILATFLYFVQAEVVARASADPNQRARIFASVDLAVGVLTLLVQFVATGKLIARFGVGRALALLPLVFAAGFAVLAALPTLAVVIAFQALQRTANFALSNPARESLYTVVERDEKYKAKNVIDTVGARGADMAGGWLVAGLKAIGTEAKAAAIGAIALAVAGIALSITLGRAQARKAIVPPAQ
jgi:AAA family ATP:ADP antiporter